MPKAGVHKDFHGAFSFCLKYVADNYGNEAAEEYLRRMALTVFQPLIARICREGLPALHAHWKKVFEDEEADFKLEWNADRSELMLHVNRCPALEHIRTAGYPLWDRFCEHTRIVNEAVCEAAGITASVEYDQDAARCVQRFRKEGA